MTLRFACFAFCLAFPAFAGPALAFGGCGVGCHATAGGACVRDGWQEGFARSERVPSHLKAYPALRFVLPMGPAIDDVCSPVLMG
jgi:hypothetical protein